jgi:hypothetical protein
VRHLRSKILIVIVSLLALAGLGQRVLGECCARSYDGQSEHAKKTPGQPHDCQCVCHAPATLTAEPVRTLGARVVIGDALVIADEFPPDAVPVGIDHPPQLA